MSDDNTHYAALVVAEEFEGKRAIAPASARLQDARQPGGQRDSRAVDHVRTHACRVAGARPQESQYPLWTNY